MSSPLDAFAFETTTDDVLAAFPDAAKGLIALITGPSVIGIGGAVAVGLAKGGAHTLILAGRTESTIQDIATHLTSSYPSVKIVNVKVDLESTASIHEAAKKILSDASIPRIDVIINNAGVGSSSLRGNRKTAEGIDRMWASSHLGHWLLTNLLIDKLLLSDKPRIVNVSSGAYQYLRDGDFADWNDPKDEDGYDEIMAYALAKAANIVHAKALQSKLGSRGLLAYSVSPGPAKTGLGRDATPQDMQTFMKKFSTVPGIKMPKGMKSVEQAGAPVLVAAIAPNIPNGAYIDDDCHVEAPKGRMEDPALAEQLWKISEEATGEKFFT